MTTKVEKEVSLETRLVMAGMSLARVTDSFSDKKSRAALKKKVVAELGFMPQVPKNRYTRMFLELARDYEDSGSQNANVVGILSDELQIDFIKIEEQMRQLWVGLMRKASPWQLQVVARLESMVRGFAEMGWHYEPFLPWLNAIAKEKVPCPSRTQEVHESWTSWVLDNFHSYSKPFHDPAIGGDALIAYIKEMGNQQSRSWPYIQARLGMSTIKNHLEVAKEFGRTREFIKAREARFVQEIRPQWQDFKQKFWPDDD